MKNHKFYMACLRDTVGSNMAFHCVDGAGYTTDIDKAAVFSKEEAQRFWDSAREFDVPVSQYWVSALSDFHVDCQYVPTLTTLVDGCTRYVGFIKGQWDGNDLYWLCDGYIPVTNFHNATIYDKPDLSRENVIWIPFDRADAVKRRTFALRLFDRRTMIQAKGLKMPEWLKRQRRRKHNGTGKVRGNCPGCGKIHWQYNPYDFDGCTHWACPEYVRRFED